MFVLKIADDEKKYVEGFLMHYLRGIWEWE